jgi:uncharacterized protein (DUF58 family)
VTAAAATAFPLVPRRRLLGRGIGAAHSARRGSGSDVAGSRPYQPGDDVRAIDWSASARFSSARDATEFVVREYYAEEAPRVVIVRDQRPAMTLYGRDFPWLRKDDAMASAAELVTTAALAAQGSLGLLAEDGDTLRWEPPVARRRAHDEAPAPAFAAARGSVARALELLLHVRPRLSLGTFVFVLSDFLDDVPVAVWIAALERGWDVVPVVIQDPVWEASFPDVSGLVVRFADPATGRVRTVRISRREAQARGAAHESRKRGLLAGLRDLGLEPVTIETNDEREILEAFLAWGQARLDDRRRGW